MRIVGTLALCAVIGMGSAAGQANAKKVSRATCYSAGKTIVANDQVRVSVVVKKGRKPGVSTARYYACNETSKQRFLLLKGGEFENDGFMRVVSPALNGYLVGFQRGTGGDFSCSGRVVVFDTKRGRVVRTSTRQPGCARTLVVTRRGFAAWGYGIEFDGDYLVGLDSAGTRVLAYAWVGDGFDVLSLYVTEGFGFAPDIVNWVQDDRPMTAELRVGTRTGASDE